MELTVLATVGLVALGLGAGVLGTLVGIGGGVIIAPVLIAVFDLDVRVAVATSLVGVVATSVAAGSVHLGSGLANLRLGLSLEVATTVGGIAGGLIATSISPRVLSILLGVVLGVTVGLLLRGRDDHDAADGPGASDDGVATPDAEPAGPDGLAGTYVDGYTGRRVAYRTHRLPAGAAIAAGAGALSGMLGVGGGFLKVPAMNLVMRVPLKVAAATSNFMVGITALASLSIYVARGYVYPYPSALVAVGVMAGALGGTRLQHRSSSQRLRWILAVALAAITVEILWDALGGRA